MQIDMSRYRNPKDLLIEFIIVHTIWRHTAIAKTWDLQHFEQSNEAVFRCGIYTKCKCAYLRSVGSKDS